MGWCHDLCCPLLVCRPTLFILEFIRLEVTIKSLSACFTSTARQVNKKVVTCELTRTRATGVQRAEGPSRLEVCSLDIR